MLISIHSLFFNNALINLLVCCEFEHVFNFNKFSIVEQRPLKPCHQNISILRQVLMRLKLYRYVFVFELRSVSQVKIR